MRVCVVEVVESCGRHLDKLINVDEFLRRITTVMHSNDPVSNLVEHYTHKFYTFTIAGKILILILVGLYTQFMYEFSFSSVAGQ